MAKHVLTVDVDGASIRLLEVQGRRVRRWASAPIRLESIANESAVGPQDSGGRIKELMRSSGIKGRTVIVGLSGLYSVSRVLAVPRAKGQSRWETIQQAVTAVMPAEQLRPVWQVLSANKDGHQVLAIGVPQDAVENEVQELRTAGIASAALEVKGIALARAVNRAKVLIINAEPFSFDIVVVVNGIPQIMHTTALHGDLSTDERAERLTTTLGLAVGFYNSAHPEEPLDDTTPLVLVGQLAEDAALVDNVQARTRFHIEPFAPPLEFPAHLPLLRYAVNIGLALREVTATRARDRAVVRLNMDLRRGVRRPLTISGKKALYLGAVLAGLVVIFLLYQVTSEAISQTAELRGELNAVEALVDLRRAELARLAEIRTKVEQYEGIIGSRGYFTGQLKLLEEVAPPGVTLKAVALSHASVSISGLAGTYAQTLDYANALRGLGIFSEVELPSMSSEGGGFTIAAAFK